MRDEPALIEAIRAIHAAICAEVVATCARASADELAPVTGKQAGDVIYTVDRLCGGIVALVDPIDGTCGLSTRNPRLDPDRDGAGRNSSASKK